MDICVLDFETYWSTTHTLSKMNPIAYVMHPETELISLAAKFIRDGVAGETQVIFGEDNIKNVCSRIDWSNTWIIAHNNEGFDAMLCAWRLGIKPKMWGCTLAMSRPHHAKEAGGSLAKLVAHYELGVKDQTALVNTKGRHLKDFTPEEVDALGAYNKADVDQCYGLFKKLLPKTSRDELRLIDMTIRMLVEPKFEVDRKLLVDTLADERHRKLQALVDMGDLLGTDDPEEVRAMLASAPKFTKLLESRGVEVPMKASPTNPDKMTPALAKTDEAFLKLQDHPDPVVATAAQTRLGVKSTILETRIQAFLDAAGAAGGLLPVPLKYYGADTTGRWSGWGFNPQNLPRVSKDNKPSNALRMCMRAPKGHKVVVADLSGIELRVNHFLWQVPSSMALFQADPEKADLYRHFAASLYRKPIDAVTKDERQVGKVCLAEGTLLLCKHSGRVFWERIERFKPEYQLWDGEEWVWAKGAVSNGWKKTQQLCGVSLTPDHLVLSGMQWLPAKYVLGEKVARALVTGAENLSLLVWLRSIGSASPRLSLSATAGFLSTRLKLATSRVSKLLGATSVLRKPQVGSGTGNTSTPCRKMNTVHAYSTDYLQRLLGAITQTTKRSLTMAGEVFTYAKNGATTALRSFGMCGLYPDGTCQRTRWTESTLTAAMTTATCGSLAGRKTCSISGASKTSNEKSLTLKHVYDILNCGPRNRFTIMSDRGPLLVHNCHLGLGFGAGAGTFQKVAKLMAGIDLNEGECVNIVNMWREEYAQIAQGWRTCHDNLVLMTRPGEGYALDPWGMCIPGNGGIRTPKGFIRYPNLRQEVGDDGKKEWWYGEGRHKSRIYAGKIVENIVQHLARCVIADNALEVKKATGLTPALMVHDELVYVVEAERAAEVLTVVQNIMRTPPVWWPELVTWSEGDIADTYGDAK